MFVAYFTDLLLRHEDMLGKKGIDCRKNRKLDLRPCGIFECGRSKGAQRELKGHEDVEHSVTIQFCDVSRSHFKLSVSDICHSSRAVLID
jgi:hypothetical protein